MSVKISAIFFFLILAFFFLGKDCISASELNFVIPFYLPIHEKNVKDGDLISSTKNGYFLSKKAYDFDLFGVVDFNSAVSFEIKETKDGIKRYPVVITGTTGVNVSAINGAIKKGDFITSSTIPGVGIKATKDATTLGISLDDFNPKNKDEVGQVRVIINIRNKKDTSLAGGLANFLSMPTLAASEEPVKVFKYILAVLVVLTSVIFGFYTFGKVASRGVEALGRNPLAARTIQLGIIFNIFLTITVILIGVVLAFFILRL